MTRKKTKSNTNNVRVLKLPTRKTSNMHNYSGTYQQELHQGWWLLTLLTQRVQLLKQQAPRYHHRRSLLPGDCQTYKTFASF